MNPWNWYKQWLSGTTMYRLLQWFLRVLAGVAVVGTVMNWVPFGPIELSIHILILVVACWFWNQLFARLFKVAANQESQYITGLILSFLLVPAAATPNQLLYLLGVSGVAMASKYLIVWRHRHVFNPAAVGALASTVLFGQYAGWWVATPLLMPLVVIGGLMLIQKLRRWRLIGAFLGAYFILVALLTVAQGAALPDLPLMLLGLVTASPLLFFTFVMLPEPLTSPSTNRGLVIYGVIVAFVLAGLQFGLPGVPYTLEVALLAGNLVARIFFPVTTATLQFLRRQHLGDAIQAYWFDATPPPIFQAGQFIELTLPHSDSDSRGVRRFFTIASAPSEPHLMLAAKFPEPMSTFKQALKQLKRGDSAYVSQVGGSFTLPNDPAAPILMVAGGIGITPFRSMLKELQLRRQQRPIVLMYAAKTPEEFVFDEVFEDAKTHGVRVIRIVGDAPKSWKGEQGRLDQAMVKRLVPDVLKRHVYLSGPEPMVEGYQKLFSELGVPRSQIKRDFFPGYEE